MGLATFESGWKWSDHVRPTMRVRTAAKRHTSGMLSGRQIILMDDGTRGVSRVSRVSQTALQVPVHRTPARGRPEQYSRAKTILRTGSVTPVRPSAQEPAIPISQATRNVAVGGAITEGPLRR